MLNISYSVKIYLCDTDVTFDDATKAGAGTAAYNAVWNGHDVKIVDYSGKDYVIRYGAICYAEITKTASTTTVEDATCPSGDESE